MRMAMVLLALLLLAFTAGFARPHGAARPLEPADEPPARPLRLGVLSFNVRYGTAPDGENAWEHRRERVFEVVKEDRLDAVGVQEAQRFQLDQILAACPEYAVLGRAREDGKDEGEFSAILYRKGRFDAPEHGTFWLSDTPEVPGSKSWGNRVTRVCTWARLVEKASGRSVYLFNTHLDHQSQDSRERSVELIARRMAEIAGDAPVVLTGDLNAGEDNCAVLYLLGRISAACEEDRAEADPTPEPAPPSPALVDTFRAVHPKQEKAGTFSGFRAEQTGGAKIDYVLVPKTARIGDAWIDRRADEQGRTPSDHFPVGAVVEFP